VVNVGIGLSLFGEGFSGFSNDLTIFYVYLTWELFLFTLIVVLFILFTVLAATSNNSGEVIGCSYYRKLGTRPQDKG
jgi:hypothetical protein